ncbi:hypothetical protein B9Z19DRAFT_1096057 [Tuber borchii]|uniref:Secreted protein n=1 Tax=Tuber borchii TaxID=42251 RepID=A0A2T6ZC04_TUBBO|nr:hypothetical protein B9Z19DRAFT_1096057 [Tuber borchii]
MQTFGCLHCPEFPCLLFLFLPNAVLVQYSAHTVQPTLSEITRLLLTLTVSHALLGIRNFCDGWRSLVSRNTQSEDKIVVFRYRHNFGWSYPRSAGNVGYRRFTNSTFPRDVP